MYTKVHWQKVELWRYRQEYECIVKGIEDSDRSSRFERQFGGCVATLKTANSRYNWALILVVVATIYVSVFSIRWAAMFAAIMLGTPHFLLGYVSERRNDGPRRLALIERKHYNLDDPNLSQYLLLDRIKKKTLERELFTYTIWSLATSGFVAAVIWSLGRGNP